MVQQTNGIKAPATTAPQAVAHALPLQVALTTHEGRVRTRNEDDWATPDRAGVPAAARKARGELLIVADGMGGQAAGEVASRMTAEGLIKRYYASNEEPRAALRDAIRQTNTDICNAARSNSAQSGMGSTVVAVLFLPALNRALLAHVGDSRIYRMRGNQIEQMTGDHSWVAEKLRSREITPEEATDHSLRHVLTRAMGAESSVQPEIRDVDLLPGDRYLLCSDGLSNMISPDEMRLELARGDMQDAANKLVALANERGGPDNITVLTALYGHADAVTSIIGRRQRKGVIVALVALVVIALASLAVFWRSQQTGGIVPTPTVQAVAAAATIDPTVAPQSTTPAAVSQATSTVASERTREVVADQSSQSANSPVVATKNRFTAVPVKAASPTNPVTQALVAPNIIGPADDATFSGREAGEAVVRVQWDKVTGADQYQVEAQQVDTGEWVVCDKTPDLWLDLYCGKTPCIQNANAKYNWRIIAIAKDLKSGPESQTRHFTCQQQIESSPTPPLAAQTSTPETPPVSQPVTSTPAPPPAQ